MIYISEKRKASFVEKLKELKESDENSFSVSLGIREILYADDAYQIIASFVNITACEKLPEGPYNPDSQLLKLFRCEGSYLWVHEHSGIYYILMLGDYMGEFDFLDLVVCTSIDSFEEVKPSVIRMYTRHSGIYNSCSLYLFFYTGKDLQPVALCAEGYRRDIKNVESYWHKHFDYERNGFLEDFDEDGLILKENDNANRYERYYFEKIVHQFNPQDRPSMQDLCIEWNFIMYPSLC